MIDVKFPIKVKDLAKVVDQANVNPNTMSDDELISEFMNETSLSQLYEYEYNHPHYDSWAKLMPVVEAINNFTNEEDEPIYSVEIDPYTCMIRRGLHTAIVVDVPQAKDYMDMIYQAVVEFAKRFHQNGQSL